MLTLRDQTGAEAPVSVTEARADLVGAERQRVRYGLAWVAGGGLRG